MDLSDPVYLVYYRYDDDVSLAHPKWYLNWLTHKITRSDYIHVEMVFSDGETYTIVPKQPISCAYDKSYRRSIYTCQMLYTSYAQSCAMRQFLRMKMRQPSSFNYWGFYLLPIFPSSGEASNKYFCSELIASAMAAGGLDFGGKIPPHTIDPGRLFDLVKDYGYGGTSVMLKSENKPLIV